MAYRTEEWESMYAPATPHPKCAIDFCQLPSKYDIDIDLLENELRNLLVDGTLMGQYPLPSGGVFPGYWGLCFKSAPGQENPYYDGLKSNSLLAIRRRHAMIDEDYTVKNDIWFPYLDEIESKFNGQITQVRLIKLDAGCNLGEKQHIDYPWYKGIRMHIPLTPGLKYEWRVLHKQYFAERSPHMYFLDTGKPHDARNKANAVDRYLLNINMIPHTTDIPIHEQIQQEIL